MSVWPLTIHSAVVNCRIRAFLLVAHLPVIDEKVCYQMRTQLRPPSAVPKRHLTAWIMRTSLGQLKSVRISLPAGG